MSEPDLFESLPEPEEVPGAAEMWAATQGSYERGECEDVLDIIRELQADEPAAPPALEERKKPTRSLAARTGVEWPLPCDRVGRDPRLVELRQALRDQADLGDADQFAWVLCVVLSWMDWDGLERVSVVVASELDEMLGEGRVAA